MTQTSDSEAIREAVRTRYAAAAVAASAQTSQSSCCGTTSSCCGTAGDASVISRDLYSGGGIDVLLSARRVGPTGFAYGLDMTDEMLALANRNAAERNVQNVSFLKGEIEHIPLPDASVDVVISNCVINLSADKPRVLREAFRVLRPGGRFAVSDVVVQGTLPAALRTSMDAWAGCLGGALEEREYRSLLADAGFSQIEVEVTRVYGTEQGCCDDSCTPQDAAFSALAAVGSRFVSAFVRASRAKPESESSQ